MQTRKNTDMPKGLAFTVRAEKFTAEIFAKLLQDYLQNKSKTPQGRTSYKKLLEQGELFSQRITDKNIGSFTEIAGKYDLKFALKASKATEPPTWTVFISSDKNNRETFDRAFREYADKILNPQKKQEKKSTISIETVRSVEEIETPAAEEKKKTTEKKSKTAEKSTETDPTPKKKSKSETVINPKPKSFILRVIYNNCTKKQEKCNAKIEKYNKKIDNKDISIGRLNKKYDRTCERIVKLKEANKFLAEKCPDSPLKAFMISQNEKKIENLDKNLDKYEEKIKKYKEKQADLRSLVADEREKSAKIQDKINKIEHIMEMPNATALYFLSEKTNKKMDKPEEEIDIDMDDIDETLEEIEKNPNGNTHEKITDTRNNDYNDVPNFNQQPIPEEPDFDDDRW